MMIILCGVVPSWDLYFAQFVLLYHSVEVLPELTDFGSAGPIKKGNRKSEILMRDVEVRFRPCGPDTII